jgi:hypothetical protein
VIASCRRSSSWWTFRAIDRARLIGAIDDMTTAVKRKELAGLLAMLDLSPMDQHVVDRAAGSFAVPLRSLDALNVAAAEVLAESAGGEPLSSGHMTNVRGSPRRREGLSFTGFRVRHPGLQADEL